MAAVGQRLRKDIQCTYILYVYITNEKPCKTVHPVRWPILQLSASQRCQILKTQLWYEQIMIQITKIVKLGYKLTSLLYNMLWHKLKKFEIFESTTG